MGTLTILGGGGFIGSHYVHDFYDQAIGNIVSINSRNDYKVYSADVLYFISTVHNSNVYVDPYLDIQTNLTVLIKTLENWRERPDASEGVFNFVSSWFVTSGIKGFYTSTKKCAEELLEAYCKAYGLKYRIIRLANVVGSGDKITDKKNALQKVIRQLKNNQDVYLHGNGRFVREYIHVSDCTLALDLVANKGNENTVYEVSNGDPQLFCDIVRYAHKYLKSKSKIIEVPGVIDSVNMCPSKLFRLGFIPKLKGNALCTRLCEES